MIQTLAQILVPMACGALAYAFGVRRAAQRQVDRILRDETRFRHPVWHPWARRRVTPAEIIECAERLNQGQELVTPWYAEVRPESLSDGSKLGQTTEDAMSGAEALRRQESTRPAGQHGASPTSCQLRSGHSGPCGPLP